MEDIIDADYSHSKRVCQDSEIKNLGEYRRMHVQGKTILLANIFNGNILASNDLIRIRSFN